MIKVGDTFEIGEVLDNLGYGYLKGKQGIVFPNKYVIYVNAYDFMYADFDSLESHYMYESEIKLIGRLIVTKVK